MIMVAMYMKVKPKNRKELSQAITSLLKPIRSEKGCIRCDFFHGMADENFFCLLKEWETIESLTKYRKSECYKVLQGAMNLLEKPCEIIFCEECSKIKLIKDINSLVKPN